MVAVYDGGQEYWELALVKLMHQTHVCRHHVGALRAQGAVGIGEALDHIHDYERWLGAEAKLFTLQCSVVSQNKSLTLGCEPAGL